MSVHIRQPLPYEEKDVIIENNINALENINNLSKSSSSKDLIGGDEEDQRRKLFSVMKLISKDNNQLVSIDQQIEAAEMNIRIPEPEFTKSQQTSPLQALTGALLGQPQIALRLHSKHASGIQSVPKGYSVQSMIIRPSWRVVRAYVLGDKTVDQSSRNRINRSISSVNATKNSVVWKDIINKDYRLNLLQERIKGLENLDDSLIADVIDKESPQIGHFLGIINAVEIVGDPLFSFGDLVIDRTLEMDDSIDDEIPEASLTVKEYQKYT